MNDDLRAEAESLAQSLRLLLEKIQSGDLSARARTKNHIEGALAALETLLGAQGSLEELLGHAPIDR